MKIFKLLAESIRLFNSVGKDIYTTNKWNYTESALKEQLKDAKILKKNISQLTTFSIILSILFFIIPMTIAAFVNSIILLILMCIIAGVIPGFILYVHLVISPSDDDIFLIKKYITINYFLNEKNDNNLENIRIFRDNDTISKFIGRYQLRSECHMIVLCYTSNTLMLYFCSNNDIEKIYPDDIITTLIDNGKITIDDYIQAIQTS